MKTWTQNKTNKVMVQNHISDWCWTYFQSVELFYFYLYSFGDFSSSKKFSQKNSPFKKIIKNLPKLSVNYMDDDGWVSSLMMRKMKMNECIHWMKNIIKMKHGYL